MEEFRTKLQFSEGSIDVLIEIEDEADKYFEENYWWDEYY